MKIHQVNQRTPEWHQLRRGKITGTGLKKILGTPKARSDYFYELLAERLTIDDGIEMSAMDRGTHLETQALEFFEQVTGKIVETIGFVASDKNQNIASSPDGLIKVKGKYREAVEIKCLSSAHHLRAWLEDSIPKDYYPQSVQYFIVNPDLEKLYFVLFDPRMTVHPMHVITIERKDIQETIDDYEEKEIELLKEVEEALNNLIEI